MERLKFFYLPGCPYCRMANRILKDLLTADARFAGMKISHIDESQNRALADRYDYWRVPSFFLGDEKLYEADPSHNEAQMRRYIENVLETVINSQIDA